MLRMITVIITISIVFENNYQLSIMKSASNQVSSRTEKRPAKFGTVRQWHWVSSAICLAGLLLFSVTGITLNHAGSIEGEAHVTTIEMTLPSSINERLHTLLAEPSAPNKLPEELATFIYSTTGHRVSSQQLTQAQWSADEVYISMPHPGGDAWLVLDGFSNELLYERTDRGLIAYLNDLHKGRHTGVLWSWFMDGIAVSCIVFALTGLWLLIRQQKQRPLTWAVTSFGLLLPLLLLLHGL